MVAQNNNSGKKKVKAKKVGEKKISIEEVLETLSEVYDPEIPVNIVDLGLIYDVKIDGNKIDVLMTMTSPGCPMGFFIVSMAEEKLKERFPHAEVKVELTFSPPWTPDRIKDKSVREKLNLL